MAVIASFVLFAILTLAISWFGYRRYAAAGRVYRELRKPAAPRAPMIRQNAAWEEFAAIQALRRLGERLPISLQDSRMARDQLVAAGIRSENAVAIFYGIKCVLAAVLLVLAVLFRGQITDNPVLRIVLLPASAAAGFFVPGFLLERRVARRRETLRLSLPDALDLMVVSVEAGLGMDQAIQNVSRELQVTHPDISDELALVNLEMRAGMRRGDALRNLSDRTGEPELRKLVAILIQSDRFGTSVGESLRTHSDFLRVRRRQEAEERAAKVGVKLVFPIFFFILPSMMVVAAGPGLLQIFKYLFPMMKNFGG
jgi:tight adherence protein C